MCCCDHPAVAQAVDLRRAARQLGEEVAAAIVLPEGADATERRAPRFRAQPLADFKVPRHILFLQEIPKGATGKIQRVGLAGKLGLV